MAIQIEKHKRQRMSFPKSGNPEEEIKDEIFFGVSISVVNIGFLHLD